MAFETVGPVLMDLEKVLYVEPGAWDATKRDHRAVFVFLGGHRFESGMGMREAEARITTSVRLDALPKTPAQP